MKKFTVGIISDEPDFTEMLAYEADICGFEYVTDGKADVYVIEGDKGCEYSEKNAEGALTVLFHSEKSAHRRSDERQTDESVENNAIAVFSRPFLLADFDASLVKATEILTERHINAENAQAKKAVANELPQTDCVTAAVKEAYPLPPEYVGERRIVFGGDGRTVIIYGAEGAVAAAVRVKLSATEYRILKLLARNAGKSVSRERLALETGASEGSNITDVYVCRLRTRLEKLCRAKLIVTVRGEGYMFVSSADK